MSGKKIIQINSKEEEAFCNLISNFRSSLSNLNSLFINLIKYHSELKETCSNIAKINNQTVKKFILPDNDFERSLTHKFSIFVIQDYLDNNQSEAPKLLNAINNEIKVRYEAFLESPESPYKVENSKSTIVKKKLDKYKNLLDETTNQTRIIDDYLRDISSIFGNSSFDDDDDDDDDDDSRKDRRYYKDPYPDIPRPVQKSINQYMTYINSLVIIRNLLNYNEAIRKCCEKLKINIPIRPPPHGQGDNDQVIDLISENEDLKLKIQQLENEKDNIANENKQKDKQIRQLERKYRDAESEIERLKEIIDGLKNKPTIISKIPAPTLDLKDDERFLNAVSYFRRGIEDMNSSFMDLIKYDDRFKDDCKKIYNVNNDFIRQIISNDSPDLGHFYQLLDIFQYYAKASQNEGAQKENICKQLFILKQKIEVKLNLFNPSDIKLSPLLYGDKDLPRKIETFEKRLKEEKESVKSLKYNIYNEIHTDFISDKIEPIFGKKKSRFDDYDDDDDDDENEQRSYGNPYPTVPKTIQLQINRFLSVLNTLISISSILEFDQYIDAQLNKITDGKSKKLISQKNEYLKEFKELTYTKINTDHYEALCRIKNNIDNLKQVEKQV